MLYKTDKGVDTPADLKIWKYVFHIAATFILRASFLDYLCLLRKTYNTAV